MPLGRVDPEQLQALLEEYVSRDGTDYGARETSLARRVEQLGSQMRDGSLQLLFETESQQWDIVQVDEAQRLLRDEEGAVSDGADGAS